MWGVRTRVCVRARLAGRAEDRGTAGWSHLLQQLCHTACMTRKTPHALVPHNKVTNTTRCVLPQPHAEGGAGPVQGGR